MRLLLPSALLILAASCSSEPGTAEGSTPSAAPAAGPTGSATNETAAGLYGLRTETLEGEAADLSAYAGQVTLVVNVASECGYTRQYAGLQELHAELESRGFAVLAFPSNEFGGQEPGNPEQIRQFCTERFDVTFPMFAKCEVKPGAGQSPVYAFLAGQTGETPGWNFCKYLVGKDGQVVAFFESGVEPSSAELRRAIEAAL